MATTVESAKGAALRFVCSTCWLVFDHGAIRACAGCGTASPPLGWPALPFEFRERYLFVEQLGRGGQGAVFRAYDRQAATDAWVAVKVAQLKSEALKEIFRREGRAAAVLSEHPQYFVGFRGSDFSDPAFLVLDFVPWPTLKRMHAIEGNLHPLDVALLGVEILRGVRCMERRSMVHRDLKPDNIFAHRCEDGSFEVKIADLGVWIDSGASEESLLGCSDDKKHFFGTPPYMSPEQIRGDIVTAASDVHAVASVLWQLSTGTVPFPSKPGASVEQRLAERLQQCRVQPPRPPSMPEDLYLILTIALRYHPEERVFVDPQTLAGLDNPGSASAARGMEKALRRFIDEYAERRDRALRESFAKIQVLEAHLANGEKKIATAQTLSTKAQDFRARLAQLGGESTGFEVILDALRAIEPQIHDWNVAVEAFVDAGRSEINYMARRADEEGKRAAELQARLDAEVMRAAALQARVDAEVMRGAELQSKGRAEAERAARAEAELGAEQAERSLRGGAMPGFTRFVVGASLIVIGLCAGFGVSSLFMSSGSSILPAQQQVSEKTTVGTSAPSATATASIDAAGLSSVAPSASSPRDGQAAPIPAARPVAAALAATAHPTSAPGGPEGHPAGSSAPARSSPVQTASPGTIVPKAATSAKPDSPRPVAPPPAPAPKSLTVKKLDDY